MFRRVPSQPRLINEVHVSGNFFVVSEKLTFIKKVLKKKHHACTTLVSDIGMAWSALINNDVVKSMFKFHEIA